MLEFVSSIFGLIIIAFAIIQGKKDGYPHLGEIEAEDENE